MPGGDGTGPWGFGPMTGRAAGFCAGFPVPGFMNRFVWPPFGGRWFAPFWWVPRWSWWRRRVRFGWGWWW